MMRFAFGTCLHALLLLIGVGTAAAADPRADAVYGRIAERLALMKPVAAWKRANGVPVEDLEREAAVLEQAGADAAGAGIVARTAMPFVRAQIEAAKEIQRCWLGRWDKDQAPVPDVTPDLVTEIRPQLLQIGEALLVEVETALAGGVRFGPEDVQAFAAEVDLDCLKPAAREEILRRLADLRLAD